MPDPMPDPVAPATEDQGLPTPPSPGRMPPPRLPPEPGGTQAEPVPRPGPDSDGTRTGPA